MTNHVATQPAFRTKVNTMLGAQLQKPAEITFAEAKKRNAERLRAKQSALKAKIGSVIDSLDEIEVDEWLATMTKAGVKAKTDMRATAIFSWGFRK